MVFASPTFLFLFLPIYLLVYYALPARTRSIWILVASWFFYGWWRIDFLALLIASSLGAGWLGGSIERARSSGDLRGARIRVTAGVTTALSLLAYFKYFNFAVDSVSRVVQLFGGEAGGLWSVVLPVGISFYIFQIISYLVDVHRGVCSAGRSVGEVAAYVSLFPQLVAGPIVRYVEVRDQIRAPGADFAQFGDGAMRFMVGVVKKVVIADAVASIADAVFALSTPTLVEAWLGVGAYAIQIYFDFAAYSDMAIGLGSMMGFTFPENFNRPYHARTITEFWRRWHMTLSRWLRDYLYIPLGGNRISASRTLINLLLVMALGGLWHGAAWTFVIWGLWHGALLVLERLRLIGEAPEPVMRLRTIVLVLVGWVFFRAEGAAEAFSLIAGMVGAHGFGVTPVLAWTLTTGSLVAFAVGVVWVVFEERFTRIYAWWPVSTALFLVSIVRVLAASYSPFLYFRF